MDTENGETTCNDRRNRMSWFCSILNSDVLLYTWTPAADRDRLRRMLSKSDEQVADLRGQLQKVSVEINPEVNQVLGCAARRIALSLGNRDYSRRAKVEWERGLENIFLRELSPCFVIYSSDVEPCLLWGAGALDGRC